MTIPKRFVTILLLVDIVLASGIIYYNQSLDYNDVNDKICEEGEEYGYLGWSWGVLPVPVYIDTSISGRYLEETQKALDVYNELGNIFREVNSPVLHGIYIEFDTVTFNNERTLGITYTNVDSTDPTLIYDSTITMNTLQDFSFEKFSCELLPITWDGPYDWLSVMVHELGHALGLAHVNDEFTTMYPYYIGSFSATLSSGEINGLNNLYNL